MKKVGIATALALVMLLTPLAGCVGTVRTPPPSHHPVDMRPVAPFSGAIWIEGHYAYRHGNYVWVPGRYMRPPHEKSVWVPGYWKEHRRGWKWQEGHWEKGHMRDRDDRHDDDRDDYRR